MDSVTTRRRYVTLLGISAAIGLAGCSSNGFDDGQGEDGPDSDSSTNGSGGATGDDDTNGGTGNGGTGNDGTGDPQSDDSASGGGGASGGNPRLRDVFAWTNSYVMEFESDEGTGTWVFHEGDSHMTWEFGSDVMESYRIGTDTYTVVDGNCFQQSIDMPADDMFDPEQPESDGAEYVASGTDTVNGEHVYVFDVEDGLYYISVATGYPVRFESFHESMVVTFHSWGATSPISPPAMECTQHG